MASSSPGAIAPATPLALLMITAGAGGGGFVMARLTGIEMGVVSTPGALMEIDPL